MKKNNSYIKTYRIIFEYDTFFRSENMIQNEMEMAKLFRSHRLVHDLRNEYYNFTLFNKYQKTSNSFSVDKTS